jgi:hypothetical protein
MALSSYAGHKSIIDFTGLGDRKQTYHEQLRKRRNPLCPKTFPRPFPDAEQARVLQPGSQGDEQKDSAMA